MNLADLHKPFPANKISWRVGRMTKNKDKAIPFAYIDARDVMERLDEVCGAAGWQARYPFPGCCEIGIKIGTPSEGGTEWVWKANGAGATDIEAEKGQFSDSFKRAGVLWGIGRYLYDVPNVWMSVNEYKQFSPETIQQLNQRFEHWQDEYFKRHEL